MWLLWRNQQHQQPFSKPTIPVTVASALKGDETQQIKVAESLGKLLQRHIKEEQSFAPDSSISFYVTVTNLFSLSVSHNSLMAKIRQKMNS